MGMRDERRLDRGVPGPAPIRVLGPHERGRFAPDAWGHLLALTRTGVLGAAELELVVERALAHVGGRVSLAELRTLLGTDGDVPPTDVTTVH